LAKAFGKHTNMDLGYCSLQVGWEWPWPLQREGRRDTSPAFNNKIKTKMLCNSRHISVLVQYMRMKLDPGKSNLKMF